MTAATLTCQGCKAEENAVLVLASTASRAGWFVHRLERPEGDVQIVMCPSCAPVLAAVLEKKRLEE